MMTTRPVMGVNGFIVDVKRKRFAVRDAETSRSEVVDEHGVCSEHADWFGWNRNDDVSHPIPDQPVRPVIPVQDVEQIPLVEDHLLADTVSKRAEVRMCVSYSWMRRKSRRYENFER